MNFICVWIKAQWKNRIFSRDTENETSLSSILMDIFNLIIKRRSDALFVFFKTNLIIVWSQIFLVWHSYSYILLILLKHSIFCLRNFIYLVLLIWWKCQYTVKIKSCSELLVHSCWGHVTRAANLCSSFCIPPPAPQLPGVWIMPPQSPLTVSTTFFSSSAGKISWRKWVRFGNDKHKRCIIMW